MYIYIGPVRQRLNVLKVSLSFSPLHSIPPTLSFRILSIHLVYVLTSISIFLLLFFSVLLPAIYSTKLIVTSIFYCRLGRPRGQNGKPAIRTADIRQMTQKVIAVIRPIYGG